MCAEYNRNPISSRGIRARLFDLVTRKLTAFHSLFSPKGRGRENKVRNDRCLKEAWFNLEKPIPMSNTLQNDFSS